MNRHMDQLDVIRIREDFPVLSREVNGHPLVYLDSAATSQKPRVMIERLSELYSHEYARVEVEAWGAGLDYWNEIGLGRIATYEKGLTDYALKRLSPIDGVRVLGDPAERLSIISFTVEGKKPKDVEKALDEEGIAVRAGKLEAEPLLKALGTEEAVRASFMFYNTYEEADVLAAALEKIVRSAD
jgi:selenocysteine lyase/cysteine desulfurase